MSRTVPTSVANAVALRPRYRNGWRSHRARRRSHMPIGQTRCFRTIHARRTGVRDRARHPGGLKRPEMSTSATKFQSAGGRARAPEGGILSPRCARKAAVRAAKESVQAAAATPAPMGVALLMRIARGAYLPVNGRDFDHHRRRPQGRRGHARVQRARENRMSAGAGFSWGADS
ncbi:hypothetical protein BV20DRAFT_111193 [Pilatotrama ljubarskyi]|nr:hypothetical protein BV20DRAFT_111193 [Pilatotrama ljubarskyi]